MKLEKNKVPKKFKLALMAPPVYNLADSEDLKDFEVSWYLFWDGRFLDQIVKDSLRIK